MSEKNKSLRFWSVDEKGNKLPNLTATPSLRNWYVDKKGKPLPKLKAKLLQEEPNKPNLLLIRRKRKND